LPPLTPTLPHEAAMAAWWPPPAKMIAIRKTTMAPIKAGMAAHRPGISRSNDLAAPDETLFCGFAGLASFTAFSSEEMGTTPFLMCS
jgi:hypothetical protein